MRVRKAVLPAAGFGTRFLPASKAVPKEMMPLHDRPIIQYAVEEAAASGIEQIARHRAADVGHPRVAAGPLEGADE